MKDRFGYRKRRQAADPEITISELAARADVGVATISRLETDPDINTTIATIDALDAAIGELEKERRAQAEREPKPAA